jgi:hypothetical protein
MCLSDRYSGAHFGRKAKQVSATACEAAGLHVPLLPRQAGAGAVACCVGCSFALYLLVVGTRNRNRYIYKDICICNVLQGRSFSLPLFQTRILGPGWIQGVCADILSHTWPVRGGDQPRTTPMPFQRISTDLCGSPDHPRRAETAERATWGTKTLPRPPTQPAPHPPRLVCGGNHGAGTHWCPSGGAPRWRRPGRRRPKSSKAV